MTCGLFRVRRNGILSNILNLETSVLLKYKILKLKNTSIKLMNSILTVFFFVLLDIFVKFRLVCISTSLKVYCNNIVISVQHKISYYHFVTMMFWFNLLMFCDRRLTDLPLPLQKPLIITKAVRSSIHARGNVYLTEH